MKECQILAHKFHTLLYMPAHDVELSFTTRISVMGICIHSRGVFKVMQCFNTLKIPITSRKIQPKTQKKIQKSTPRGGSREVRLDSDMQPLPKHTVFANITTPTSTTSTTPLHTHTTILDQPLAP